MPNSKRLNESTSQPCMASRMQPPSLSAAKVAVENLTVLIRTLMRRGILDMVAVDGDSVRAVNDDFAAIRRALDVAHERAKTIDERARE